MRDLILKNLSLAIDPKVVIALLASYENLTARVRRGDLDAALGEGGKFVEHTLRAVEFIRTGVAPPEIKAPHQTVKDIEKDTKLPEGLRLLIPRIAHAMIYDIRSKRGAIHVKEIDPRAIDAALCVQAASWVIAEFLRQYHSDDESAVSLAMETLMRPHVPFIERFGDEHVVTRKVPCDVELLLLLSREASQGLDRRALGQSSKYPPPTVTRTLQRLGDARHVHRTRDGQYHITGAGDEYMADQLRTISA
jgi:DNA-binding transcriptional ArsR family regulator